MESRSAAVHMADSLSTTQSRNCSSAAAMESFDTTAHVLLQDHCDFGLSAFAQKSFNAGDIVLCEEPLLISADPADKLIKKLSVACERQAFQVAGDRNGLVVTSEVWCRACSWMVAFFRATTGTQQRVIQQMHNKPVPGSLLVSKNALLADVLAEVAPNVLPNDSSDMLNTPTIIKLLLAFDMNAHDLQGRSALFEKGSKLAHTCAMPNTEYKSCQGKGYHVALRPIAAGELLTTSYMDSRKRLMSTIARRRILKDEFGFNCTCERCSSEVDEMRVLPCPSCAPVSEARRPDGTLPPTIVLGEQRPTGLLQFHAISKSSSCGSASSTSIDAPFWQCSNCRACLPDDDSAFFPRLVQHLQLASSSVADSSSSNTAANKRVEERLSDAVYGFDKQLDEHPVAGSKQTMSLVAMAAKTIGSDHWVFHYALLLHTEVLLADLKGCGQAVEIMGPAAPRAMILQDFEYYLFEIEDNWQLTWAWLHDRIGLDAASMLSTEMMRCALGLLQAATWCSPLMNSNGLLVARVRQLATTLLSRAEPTMAVYQHWPLPEPHPAYAELCEAQQLLAALDSANSSHGRVGGAVTATGSRRQQQLSMQELLEFLPASGSSGHAAPPSTVKGGRASGPGKPKGKRTNKHKRK